MSRKKINLSNPSGFFYSKAIEITIIALALLVPIAFHPRCYTTFAPAKEFIFEALVIIGLTFWAFKMINREEIKLTTSPLNLPVLCFIAICTLSLIWSDTFFTSLNELPHFLAGPLLYFVIVNNIRDEKQINRIISAVLVVGTALGIYGIFQYNNITLPFWVPKSGRSGIFGLCGNVGYFAGYLILPLSLAIPLFLAARSRTRKILLLLGILAMGITLVMTIVRSSYLALGVSILFMFLLFLLSRGKNFIQENKKFFMIVLIAILIAASLFIIPTSLNKPGTAISQIKSSILDTNFMQDRDFTRRIAIWKFTGMMIKDHPILGSGIGTYKYNTLRYQAKFFEQGDNRSIYPYGFADKAHNEYLQLWAELGTIGLAIFLWLIIVYFIYGIRYLKREKNEQKQGIMIGLMGAVSAFLVDGFFWFPLHLSSNLSLFWLFIGLATAMGIKGIEEAKEKERLEAEKIEKKIIDDGKGKKEKSDNIADININKNKRSNIYRFKPVLYIVIVLLAVFLCVTVFRPFMSRIIWYSGFNEIRNKNWEKVTDIYERALKWNPHEGYFHFDLGKIFLMRELGNTALKSFKEAEKYIDFPGLPQDIAIIHIAKGELEDAINEMKKAISYQRGEETMPPLYVELGNTYLKLERYELAEAAFKDALKIDSNLLAEADLEQNRTDEGLVELKNKINSDLVDVHRRLSEAYLIQNKIEESLVELREAVSITYRNSEEKMPPLYVELGNAYLKLGRYEPAEEAFNDALKIDSNIVSAHYGLSGVYLRQNKVEEGLIELKKVVELGPESEEAKYAQDAIIKIEQAKSDSQPTN